MPLSDTAPFQLSELQAEIKQSLKGRFPQYVWVHAEIHEIMEQVGGHCYLVLVEKKDDTILAKARATIWNFTYRMLKPYFESATGIRFAAGIKVSLKISVEFHEVYGLNLNIKDIDPKYTIGDVALQKKITLEKLEEDGIIDMNKELPLPSVIQRVAVVSSKTAAGLQDWQEQLKNNAQGYTFQYDLFDARMQGDGALPSIVSALEAIYEKNEDEGGSYYDAVVIIRGGGSKLDLSIFDHYELAQNIAQFPLPIITGIGHERDQSVADLVAHISLKTPTAVAEFIIQRAELFDDKLNRIARNIIDRSRSILQNSKDLIFDIQEDIEQVSQRKIKDEQAHLLHLSHHLLSKVKATQKSYYSDIEVNLNRLKEANKWLFFKRQARLLKAQQGIVLKTRQKLERETLKQAHIFKILQAYRPEQILQRGFCILEQGGSVKTSLKNICKDEKGQLVMKDGRVEIELKSLHKA